MTYEIDVVAADCLLDAVGASAGTEDGDRRAIDTQETTPAGDVKYDAEEAGEIVDVGWVILCIDQCPFPVKRPISCSGLARTS